MSFRASISLLSVIQATGLWLLPWQGLLLLNTLAFSGRTMAYLRSPPEPAAKRRIGFRLQEEED